MITVTNTNIVHKQRAPIALRTVKLTRSLIHKPD